MARCAEDAELAVEVLALLLLSCWTLYHAVATDEPCCTAHFRHADAVLIYGRVQLLNHDAVARLLLLVHGRLSEARSTQHKEVRSQNVARGLPQVAAYIHGPPELSAWLCCHSQGSVAS